jgi:alkylation response protein AidB-like acyl-CoA dehydrogenase
MALAVTDEHRQLAEAVTGWAERHSPPGTARDAIDGAGLVYREKLAPGLASQGLLGLHLPETAGGQGYGLPELAVHWCRVPFCPPCWPARSWPRAGQRARPERRMTA